MKKQWFPLVFVLLLVLAPVARAADESAVESLGDLIDQLIGLFVGDQIEAGEQYPPHG